MVCSCSAFAFLLLLLLLKATEIFLPVWQEKSVFTSGTRRTCFSQHITEIWHLCHLTRSILMRVNGIKIIWNNFETMLFEISFFFSFWHFSSECWMKLFAINELFNEENQDINDRNIYFVLFYRNYLSMQNVTQHVPISSPDREMEKRFIDVSLDKHRKNHETW